MSFAFLWFLLLAMDRTANRILLGAVPVSGFVAELTEFVSEAFIIWAFLIIMVTAVFRYMIESEADRGVVVVLAIAPVFMGIVPAARSVVTGLSTSLIELRSMHLFNFFNELVE
jgi:hypothetical protein